MRKIEAVSITTENFAPYGYIANITEPGDAYGLGTAPCVFHRDMVLAPMASTAPVAFGSLKLDPRPLVVEDVEYHSAAVEILLPLDEDVVMVAGPANDDRVEPALLKAFVVPAGTLVAFRAGVWHGAPFPLHQSATVLICLPERTYLTDTKKYLLAAGDKTAIELV